MTITTVLADYSNVEHCNDILSLMKHYSQDPMGGGKPLSQFSQDNLIGALAALPNAISFLSYINGQAVGLANSFIWFSTFKCKPLLNIHDIVVLDSYRGQGVSRALLEATEQLAIEKNCCRLTLEVLEGNLIARKAYEKLGFSGYELDPSAGKALFWEKAL